MNISFKISKLATQYFFISNLTEWHFSCRHSYNLSWLEQTGPLNKEEKKALLEIKKIIKSKLHYGRQFFIYPPKKAWEIIKEDLNREDYLKFRNAFALFDYRFEKIWNKIELERWAKDLQKCFYSDGYQNLLIDLGKLFSFNNSNLEGLIVYILPCPIKDRHPAGGANLDSKAITLEVPIYNDEKWFLEAGLAIIAHEIAHIMFDNSKLKKIIDKIDKNIKKYKLGDINLIKPERTIKGLLKEILIGIFVPAGYLAQKYLREYSPLTKTTYFTNIDKSFEKFSKFKKGNYVNFRNIEPYFIWHLYPVAAYYIKEGKYLNKRFIELILEYFK